MLDQFITRSRSIALVNGISQYYLFGNVTIYTGTVDGKDCTWDEHGRFKPNQLFGDSNRHALDLVEHVEERISNPGVYYIERKSK